METIEKEQIMKEVSSPIPVMKKTCLYLNMIPMRNSGEDSRSSFVPGQRA